MSERSERVIDLIASGGYSEIGRPDQPALLLDVVTQASLGAGAGLAAMAVIEQVAEGPFSIGLERDRIEVHADIVDQVDTIEAHTTAQAIRDTKPDQWFPGAPGVEMALFVSGGVLLVHSLFARFRRSRQTTN